MNVRHAVAGNEYLTEAEIARADDPASEEVSPRVKAALRWADAYLLHPDEVDAELRLEMSRHFDAAELIELTFALMRFQSGSKLRILFGLTPAIEPGTRS